VPVTQRCPNCQLSYDVSVYVTGQRLPCKRCGLKFEVVRNDVPQRSDAAAKAAPVASPVAKPATVPASPKPPRRRGPETAPWGDRPEGEPEKPTAIGVARPLPAPIFSSTPAARPAAIASAAPRTGSAYLEETLTNNGNVAMPGGPKPPVIPGFELIGIVGRGGMGEVWRARQLSLSREVAIKTLAAHLAEEPDFVKRFEKEATALAALSHPNVVGIFDRGSFGGIYYLVMEFVTGPSLREKMITGAHGPELAFDVTAQVLAAMDYAHRRGIVHRDLKPENILLAAGDHAKVADFGLAAILGRESSLLMTRPSVAMGTLSYMAPEQRKDAHAVDGRADLYSLAVILYEMLTQELPVGRFQLPSRRLPKLDRRIDDVLEKALAPEPNDRYQTAAELAAALASLDKGDGAPAGLRGWLRKLRS
jgi:serine/threonine-protein kinase